MSWWKGTKLSLWWDDRVLDTLKRSINLGLSCLRQPTRLMPLTRRMETLSGKVPYKQKWKEKTVKKLISVTRRTEIHSGETSSERDGKYEDHIINYTWGWEATLLVPACQVFDIKMEDLHKKACLEEGGHMIHILDTDTHSTMVTRKTVHIALTQHCITWRSKKLMYWTLMWQHPMEKKYGQS